MGTKTTLAGLSISNAGKTALSAAGTDIAGVLQVCQRDCEMLILRLTGIVNILTTADASDSNADSGVVTSLGTLITNLS